MNDQQIKEIANWLKKQNKHGKGELRIEISKEDDIIIYANKEGLLNLASEILLRSLKFESQKYIEDIESDSLSEEPSSFSWLSNNSLLIQEDETILEPTNKSNLINLIIIAVVILVIIIVVYFFSR